jgi:hypothetical protein
MNKRLNKRAILAMTTYQRSAFLAHNLLVTTNVALGQIQRIIGFSFECRYFKLHELPQARDHLQQRPISPSQSIAFESLS